MILCNDNERKILTLLDKNSVKESLTLIKKFGNLKEEEINREHRRDDT